MGCLRVVLAVFAGSIVLTAGGARASFSPVCVQDDTHQSVCISSVVERVVSLAPHTTELVAYAGGFDRLVGVDSASNYPDSVQSLAHVGDSQRVDMERLLSLQPDLVVVWGSGVSPGTLKLIKEQGIPVFVSEPLSIQAVADNMIALGRLLGQIDPESRAKAWLKQFEQLKADYGRRESVKVFYQIWESPLMTIGGQHLIDDVIQLCGGVNVFESLDVLAPVVSLESVIAGNPDLIVTSGNPDRAMASLSHWAEWKQLAAVQNKHYAIMPSDVLVRNGPRLIEGARAMCTAIDRVRR